MMGVKFGHNLLSNVFSFIFTFTQCKLIIRNIFLLTFFTYLLLFLLLIIEFPVSLAPLLDERSLLQSHKQKYFKAGEISQNQGTSINILSKSRKKKVLQGKLLEFFFLGTVKTIFRMKNSTQIWTQSRPFFAKLGHFLRFLKKGRGRPLPFVSPPLPSASGSIDKIIIVLRIVALICFKIIIRRLIINRYIAFCHKVCSSIVINRATIYTQIYYYRMVFLLLLKYSHKSFLINKMF